MLRSLSPRAFDELVAFEMLHPRGDDLMDRRFALLASIVAMGLGVNALDGQPFGIDHFLRHLHPDQGAAIVQAAPARKQSVEEMQMHIDDWIDASNQVRREAALISPKRKRRITKKNP